MMLASLTAQLQGDADNAQLYLSRAKVYVALGDKAKALDDLETAIAHDDKLAEAYMLRGQLRYQLHDKNGSFEDLQKAVSLDPSLLSSLTGEYKSKDAPKTFRF